MRLLLTTSITPFVLFVIYYLFLSHGKLTVIIPTATYMLKGLLIAHSGNHTIYTSCQSTLHVCLYQFTPHPDTTYFSSQDTQF